MIAAGRVAEDAVCDAIRKASELKPVRRAMTQAEIDAWENLIAVWGDEVRTLQGSSARDIAEAAVVAMMTEADKLLQNPSVRLAYEKFLTVAELAKEIRN
jgi:arsenate reductase-like glutaredoxin family protein